MLPSLTESDVRRFTTKVARKSNDSCWLWTGAPGPGGYGRFNVKGIDYLSHRIAYLIANGPFDCELFVLHDCDIRLCVNPGHLWLGTQLDNRQDCARKGHDRGPRNTGTQNGQAKLSEDEVLEIRFKAGLGIPYTELAKTYNTVKSNIGRIVRLEIWQSV